MLGAAKCLGNVREGAPQVSWLLCSHKIEPALRMALASCLDQTFIDFEVIFVANGDQHKEIEKIVREWFVGDLRLRIFSTPIRGLTFSLNLGLHHARGELIARMDADDIAESDRLEVQVSYMNQHSSVLVLGTAFKIIGPDGQILRTTFPPRFDAEIRRALVWRNPICHPSVMYRRHEITQAGGYLGGLYAEDYDLWVRIASGPRLAFHNMEYAGISYRATGAEARGSAVAYSSQAGTQIQRFVMTGNLLWLLGALSSWIKALRVQLQR